MPPTLPRRARLAGAVVAALLLLLAFVALGFPYERLRARVEHEAERATEADVSIGSLGPGLGLTGPVLHASDVSVRTEEGALLRVDELRVGPALASLALRPALRVDARGSLGRAHGTVYLGERTGFSGTLEEIDLGSPPLARLLSRLGLTGRGRVDGTVRDGGTGLRGHVTFELTDGSFQHPSLPFALPYASLRGELEARDDGSIDVRHFGLDGPLLGAEVTGRVGAPAPHYSGSPLDLRATLHDVEPQARGLLQRLGVRVGRDGRADVRLAGTLSAPRVR